MTFSRSYAGSVMNAADQTPVLKYPLQFTTKLETYSNFWSSWTCIFPRLFAKETAHAKIKKKSIRGGGYWQHTQLVAPSPSPNPSIEKIPSYGKKTIQHPRYGRWVSKNSGVMSKSQKATTNSNSTERIHVKTSSELVQLRYHLCG